MTQKPIVFAVVENGQPVAGTDAGAPVPWWSFTKTILAAAALVLARDGRLALDWPQDGGPYTPRRLLQHTAGIACYTGLDAYRAAVARGDTPWSGREMLDRVAAVTAPFAAGEGWGYSNTGYFLVRRIVEDVTGLEIGAALDRLVLGPLGIEGVSVARSAADMAGTAWGNATGYHPGWVYHGLLTGPPLAAALALDRLFGGDLLPPDLLGEMCRPFPLGETLLGRPWVRYGYGLGLMISADGEAGRCMGHTGQGPDSVAAVYRFPDRSPPRTAAAFAAVPDQEVAEWAAVRYARGFLKAAPKR